MSRSSHLEILLIPLAFAPFRTRFVRERPDCHELRLLFTLVLTASVGGGRATVIWHPLEFYMEKVALSRLIKAELKIQAI